MTASDILRQLGASGESSSGAKAFLRTVPAFNRCRKPSRFASVSVGYRSIRAVLWRLNKSYREVCL